MSEKTTEGGGKEEVQKNIPKGYVPYILISPFEIRSHL